MRYEINSMIYRFYWLKKNINSRVQFKHRKYKYCAQDIICLGQMRPGCCFKKIH